MTATKTRAKTKAVGHLCATKGLKYVRSLSNERHAYECVDCWSIEVHSIKLETLFLSQEEAERKARWTAK